MKQHRRTFAIWVGLILAISCAPTNSIEGVWQGKVLEKKGRDSGPWTITLTKTGNDYGGQLVANDENNGKEIKSTLGELKIEGEKLSFLFGQVKCEGAFSSNNSKLKGKCLFNLESIPNGYQKGEEMMVFALTKK